MHGIYDIFFQQGARQPAVRTGHTFAPQNPRFQTFHVFEKSEKNLTFF
jgi:hypothetical protein